MSAPPSPSLSQSSSGSSTSYFSMSSEGNSSSLVDTEIDTLYIRKKCTMVIDAAVQDYSHDNKTYNLGQMNLAHGNNIIQNIHVGVDPLDVYVLKMTRSLNAEYDMVGRAQRELCAPQTREYVLGDLKKWCSQTASPSLYWLNGMPGTGKTTIAYTLCHYLQEHRLLGASFFCSRSVADCQDIQLVFPTIAFQLARHHLSFGKELAAVLHRDPDIPRRELGVQLRRLIIEPFEAQECRPSDLVVVVDALDECSGGQSIFLQALFDYASQLPFRLILTSRPEFTIYDFFQAVPSLRAHKFSLHEVEKDLVREDIIKYIRSKLSAMSSPPNTSVIEILADHAGSAFIFAATIVRLVMDQFGDPKERLETVLKALASKSYSVLTAPLDTLYTEILSRISNTTGIFRTEVESIKNILFTVICAREPLTKQTIAGLWNLDEVTVDRRLRLLRSVVFVPEDPDRPITTFHTSFSDFITDKSRSGNFYCDVAAFHDRFAMLCIRTMNGSLFQNICDLIDRPPNDEITTETIHKHVGAGLVYASIHWTYHLELSRSPGFSSKIIEECQRFSSKHMLHWFECMSLLNCLPFCERGLRVLQAVLRDKETTRLVHDARQFIRLNYDAISYAANETYFSALMWVPKTSLLYSRYKELWANPRLPKVLRGLPPQWTETSRAVKTHLNKVTSVAITRDGGRIISGSDDMTVRVWNISAHKEECVFTGHGGPVSAVAVSSDGRIYSSSSDRTVRIWDMENPDSAVVFRGHSWTVRCISVSSNGQLACSSDILNNILVWDTGTTEVVISVNDANVGSAATESLVFMSDNNHVAYVSYDTVRIRNVKSGAVLQTFRGHRGDVECVAVSPRDTQLITGSADKTAKIWNVSSGKKVRTLRGHEGPVQSAAFFSDHCRVITGSEDKTLRIWGIDTGETILILTGHLGVVWSVAIFPDDTNIVSGSGDASMLIWTIPKSNPKRRQRWASQLGKAVTPKKEDSELWTTQIEFITSSRNLLCLLCNKKAHILDSSTLTEKTTITVGHVLCIAISPDETCFATAINTVIVRDIATGRKLFVTGNEHCVAMSITYSHDSSRIAVACMGSCVHIWCAVSGKVQLGLRHPDGNVLRSVAFSFDDSRIVSTSSDRTVWVWDAITGHAYRVFQTHSWITCAVFSADGNQVIASTVHSIYVWNVQEDQLVQTLDGYREWTILPNGVSYTIHDSGWIYRSIDPTLPPTRLCWVPPSYRPSSNELFWKPAAFSSSSGDRVFLTKINGAVVLDLSTI